jgi:hypothetical protein
VNRVQWHQAVAPVRLAIDDPIRLDHGPGLERRPSREQPHPCPSLPGEVEHDRIIGVDHGPVVVLLVFKDPRFRRDVGVNIRMPVEMVGRHVQQYRNPRMKIDDPFKLKTARLDDV